MRKRGANDLVYGITSRYTLTYAMHINIHADTPQNRVSNFCPSRSFAVTTNERAEHQILFENLNKRYFFALS
jgi:hypothetical protein